MKNYIAILLTLVLIVGSLAGSLAQAQEPVNEVQVDFNSEWIYGPLEGIFNNGEVTGAQHWHAGISNSPDDTSEPVSALALSLASEWEFRSLNPAPEVLGPPTYEWPIGNLTQGSSTGVWVGDISPDPFPVTYTPGFDASRSADKTEFSAPGNQTLTITLTPRDVTEGLYILVHANEDEVVNPVITSPSSGDGIYLSPDGHHLGISPTTLEGNTTYTVQVTILVTPKVSLVDFMPFVGAYRPVQIDSGTDSGGSFSYPVGDAADGIGTWIWTADGNYNWNWVEGRQLCVHFRFWSRDMRNWVYTEYQTSCWHGIPGDDFINGEVEGNKNWNSNMHNAGDGTGQQVANVTSTLDSVLGMPFEWMNPEPAISAYPHYEWDFGNIIQGDGANIGVGASWASTTFAPGFDVSRSITPLELTASGTQTLAISVTPREEGMEQLWINVQVWEDSFLIPEIISPTTDEEAGIWLSGDGRNLHVSIQEPGNNTEYTIPVTIYVELKEGVDLAEHMPQINVAQQSTVDSGQTLGNSTGSHTIVGLGDWFWQADGNYLWDWRESLIEGVGLGGYHSVSFQAEDVATEQHFHLSNKGLHLYDGIPVPDGSDSIYGNLFTFTHPETPSLANITSWSYVNDVNAKGKGEISGSFTMEVHRSQCGAQGGGGQCFDFGEIDGTITVSFKASSYYVPHPLCAGCDPIHYNFEGTFTITGGTGFYEGISGSGTIGGTFHDHEWSGDTPDPLQKWFDFVMIGQTKF